MIANERSSCCPNFKSGLEGQPVQEQDRPNRSHLQVKDQKGRGLEALSPAGSQKAEKPGAKEEENLEAKQKLIVPI